MNTVTASSGTVTPARAAATRYAVVSDIHANWPAWCAVRDDLLAQAPDVVICLGDVIGYGPSPAQVLADVRAHCDNCVLGNHEAGAIGRLDLSIFSAEARRSAEWTRRQLDPEARRFLRKLPLVLVDDDAVFVHAETPAPEDFGYVEAADEVDACFAATDARFIFLGHTHQSAVFVLTAEGELLRKGRTEVPIEPGARYLVNAGSVGDPRDGTTTARYALFDRGAGVISLRSVPFDIDAFLADVQRHPEFGIPWFLRKEAVKPLPEHAIRTKKVTRTSRRGAANRAATRIRAKARTAAAPASARSGPGARGGAAAASPDAAAARAIPSRRRRRTAAIVLGIPLLAMAGLLATRLFTGRTVPLAPAAPDAVAPARDVQRPPAPPTIVLRAQDAQCTPGLRIETYQDTPSIGYWNDLSDFVSWPIRTTDGGTYAVAMDYALDPSSSGSEILLECGESRLVAKLKQTSGWDSFATGVRLGSIEIPAGESTLVVRGAAKSQRRGSALVNLRSVTLRPSIR